MIESEQELKLLVIGGSRGIGAAVCKALVAAGDDVYAVSRTPSKFGQWIEADISTDEGLQHVVNTIGKNALDGLLYLGGIWESGAFSESYSFAAAPQEEIRQIIAVNLIAPILLAQQLSSQLNQSSNPRIILMGSTSGLDGSGTPEVAYTASKFGLRGTAEALRLCLPRVGVTVINPSYFGTEEVQQDIAEGRVDYQIPIPLNDVVAAINFTLATSVSTTVAEINMTQRSG